MRNPGVIRIARSALALTWLYNGLWLKILDYSGRHEAIVATVPSLDANSARAVTLPLGVLECLVAAAVLSGRWVRPISIFQVILLLSMNAGGLLWARGLIPDPADMLVHSFAFIALILCLAHLVEKHHVCNA